MKAHCTGKHRLASTLRLACAVTVCLWAAAVAGSAAEIEQCEGKTVAAGRVLVRFKKQAALQQQASTGLRAAGMLFGKRHAIADGETWSLPAGMPVGRALKLLASMPGVELVEPVGLHELAAVPNDTTSGQQYAPILMHLPQAWDVTTGSSQVFIAVIDTGIRRDHEDLVDNIWINTAELYGKAGVDDDQNGYRDDIYGWNWEGNNSNTTDTYGHGTAVAGIAGARGNNAKGIAGVCWNVRLMALKASDTVDHAIQAASYALNQGAGVVNASYVGGFSTFELDSMQSLQDAGVLVVAAAGNSSINDDTQPQYPACYRLANIVSVGASANDDEVWYAAAYGKRSVDLFAPGTKVRTTSYAATNAYGSQTGSSFATAHVSGLAALLKARYPDIGPRELRLLILEGADPEPAMAELCITGGRANAWRSLNLPRAVTLQYPQTYSDPGLAIPDGGQVQGSIHVPDSLAVRDALVWLRINHSATADLQVTLASPDGTTNEIVYGKTISSDRRYCFQTQWAFRGRGSAGDWVLTVRDTQANGRTGWLKEWRLEILTYGQAAGGVWASQSSATIKNSIVWGNTNAYRTDGLGSQIGLDTASAASVGYSDVAGGRPAVYCENGSTLAWANSFGGDAARDLPQFADPIVGDYHEKSTDGRWDPTAAGGLGAWVNDAAISPCIDAGDPASSYANEPDPHGFRINQGAYGNTPEASKHYRWPTTGDTNGDCSVNILDLILVRNRLGADPATGDNWKADLNRDGKINILDIIAVRNRLNTKCAP